MIIKIAKATIISFLIYLLAKLLTLQVIYWIELVRANQMRNISYTLDVSLYQEEPYIIVLFVLKIISILVFFAILFRELWNGRRGSDKLEKQESNRLLTRWQRQRGSVRVQYNRKGEITRNTLECYFDNLIKPITRLQNKVASHFHLPENRKMNTVTDIVNVDGSIRHNISGIPISAFRKYFLFGDYNRIYFLENVIHALFIGMTGKGKSETFVMPMIKSNIDAGEGMFVHDPKGQLKDTFMEELKEQGYKVIVIDFVNPEESDGWNPLGYPYDKWKKAVEATDSKDYHDAELSEAIELVLDISKTISYQEDAQNPFWHEGAGDMIAGGAFFAMEHGLNECVNFTTVNYLYQLGDSKTQKEPILQKYLEKYRSPEDQSTLKMSTFFDAESVTRSSLKATFKNKMSLLTATPAIQKLLGTSTFTFDEIFNHKTAVFMVTHDEKTTYYPLVTMFIKQLYEAGIKITRDNPDSKKLKVPFNMYIDEMGLLPEIKDVEAMYGAGRSRGVHIYAFFQTIAQLVQKYETEGAKIIEDNSTHVVYLGSKLKEVHKYFEDMAGKTQYYSRSDRKWKERPVIPAEKLEKFEKGRSLITAVEWNPYISKLPPYSEYVFARAEKKHKRVMDKPKPKWINIVDEYEKKQKKKYKDEGASIINFNQLGAMNEAVDIEDDLFN